MYAPERSGNELKRSIQRTLFDSCAWAEPGRVQAVVYRSGTPLMIHVLGDGVQQAPGSTVG
jgi:hypothetical protein